MDADATDYRVRDRVSVWEGSEGDEREVFSRSWERSFPRDFT